MNYPDELKIGGRIYSVEYVKALKGTSSVRIKNARVILRLSRFAFGGRRDEIIQKFLKWASKKLEKAKIQDFIMPVYKDGGRICTHNKIYEIKVKFGERKNSTAKLEEGSVIGIFLNKKLAPSLYKKVIQILTEKIIIKDQENYLKEVIDELNQLYFQEKYNICRFKRTHSRFGSCSKKENINIAYKLLFAPREVFRYVCLHELAHLKEMNHSRRFWDLVESAMPDYKKHEKWLREKGLMLG